MSSERHAYSHVMRRSLTAVTAVVVAGLLTTVAVAVTQPRHKRTEGAPIAALSVTGAGVTYAVADNAARTDCAHVYYWHTQGGKTGIWRLGKPTDEPCRERPSTGDGISAVAMSSARSLWVQYAGGNLRDWQLFTATPTRTKPRQLAFVEQDVDLPPPIVVGQGTYGGTPYAVRTNVTFLGDNGAAVFKWTAPAAVRLIASGDGPGHAVVAVFLDSGVLDLLSSSGSVTQSYAYAPGELSALYLSPLGVLAQDGATVQIRKGANTSSVPLPAGAKMIGFGQGRIFYSLRGSVHALDISGAADSLLVPGKPARPVLASFATAGGFAWAIGNTIAWTCTACMTYGP